MRYVLMLVVSLAMASFTACSNPSSDTDSKLSVSLDQYVLLGDRSDADRERVYIFSADQIFIADHIFPGYRDRKYFIVDSSSISVDAKWSDFDELEGPFLPGGPTGYCVIYDNTGKPQQDMNFDAIHGKPSDLMHEIDRQTRQLSSEVEAIPEWVKQQPELYRFVAP